VTSNPTVLLTGASGVLGQALIDELRDHDLLCLTHRRSPGEGVATVTGDLTRPMLGLTPRRYAELTSRVDVVLHCAAVTGFSAGHRSTHELNVRGTRQVVELAERSGATLLYVSTAFVARTDLFTAMDEQGNDGEGRGVRPGHYLTSKRAAEALVRESGVPAAIVRPSIVIGDSRDGRISRFQGMHAMFRALLTGAAPMLPMRAEALVDMVPQDLVARAVRGLLEAGTRSGEYWVTAGNAALTARHIVDTCLRYAAEAGVDVHPPRLVPPEMMERLIRPVFIDPLPAEARRHFDDLQSLTTLFGAQTPFPSDTAVIPGLGPVTRAESARALLTSLDYLVRTAHLGRAWSARTTGSLVMGGTR
jgi:nucleoside-diphosphate-sugar epimerase